MPKWGLWAPVLVLLLQGAWAAVPSAEELEAEDRKELVRPAPPDFKPEAEGRKLRLTLIPRDKKIRKGENLWYRLEVQNIGNEDILFAANWSFFKVGYGEYDKYAILVTTPGGVEREPPTRLFLMMGHTNLNPIILDWAKLSDTERAEASRKIADEIPRKKARGFALRVNLRPGETLNTRPWKHLNPHGAYLRLRKGDDPFPAVSGEFREMAFGENVFNAVGTYRIRVIFSSNPWLVAPDEEEIQEGIQLGLSREWQMQQHEERLRESLGRFESNAVEVEVLPGS